MSQQLPKIFALAPGGHDGAAFVVAAGRAGGLGILDFPDGTSPSQIVSQALHVAKYGAVPFGIRVRAAQKFEGWLADCPATLTMVIGRESPGTHWTGFAAQIHEATRLPLAEVLSRASAAAAASAGVAGLIGAGHEAGGFGSDSSSFILLQELLAETDLPVWIRGGIGKRVAAGCLAAGAAGVVLDGSLLLARESLLSAENRQRIERWDGSETAVFGPAMGSRLRAFARGGLSAITALRDSESSSGESWYELASAKIGWGDDQAWPVGQDAALARDLAARFVTVGGIIQEFERVIAQNQELARELRPLAEGSPLSQSHATRYPIVQGPMTRVSDTVAFAEAVADGGGLPFLALAMLSGPEIQTLLEDARSRLDGKSWGVGVLGFVPPELRKQQIDVIRKIRPPFALIAGGRPDQAKSLEAEGIATYLHVPSPGLLKQYLKDGARRFVFEGRECGGHVGPRSSFLLWEQSAEVLENAIDGGVNAEEIHVLFAGGIHDSRSSALVAALSASLAARGAKLGVLMGTAYLFTREAVETGAIVQQFQREAMRCQQTLLLETGPGHEVRISPSPFAKRFDEHRKDLIAKNRSAEEIRAELESLNAGRLRIAAKGVDRHNGPGSRFVQVLEPDQLDRGLYMLGQAASLRHDVVTIAELHQQVCADSSLRLDNFKSPDEIAKAPLTPSDIAIVGLSGIFPRASNAQEFWENTLKGLDTITEIPADRWDWRLYYDADPKAPDKIISKWGGFIPDIAFDPLKYGMPPNSLASIEPVQLLMLESVRAAIQDAGYAERPFPRERTSVVLGIGGGAAQLAMGYAFRSYLPMLDAVRPGAGQEAIDACNTLLPQWTEDSFPGFLLNVTAGRVANRFDLGGSNFTVDAACGSSLAAANLAVRELEAGAADMVILGGADTVQNPLTYLAFSKTQAFSPRGRCRPFDNSADGIVISEGVATIVLKRLKDAERDGDRIYAVIKGIGASSDGRARGLTAPRPEGQIRALKRAYEKAGIDPKTVGYVEAHGTGTAVGDVVEVSALSELLRDAGAARESCAVGSVKSSIGHAKCAAGMAGLINAALALHHRVLPPTIGVETPNPRTDWVNGPLHVSGSKRPWLHADATRPRRAGVSAFGFGGTNFHAVLEAYEGVPAAPTSPVNQWAEELFLWKAESTDELMECLAKISVQLDAGASPKLRDLAHTLAIAFSSRPGAQHALSIVASSRQDLRSKIDIAQPAIRKALTRFDDPRGVYFATGSSVEPAKVAFLFPGQGCQSPGMLSELAVAFPEVRESFEAFDAALIAKGRSAIGPKVFPPPSYSDQDREHRRAALLPPDAAQTAIGAASVGVLNLLRSLGVEADYFAGHSYGELVALHAAGCFSVDALVELSDARGRFLIEAAKNSPGSMAAVTAGPERIAKILFETPDVNSVNFNGPKQTVVAGPTASVAKVVAKAHAMGIRCRELAVASAFHTTAVAGAREPLAKLAAKLILNGPKKPVISNLDVAPHPTSPQEIARRLGEHLVSPVRFAETVKSLYESGCTTFIEVGPGGTLASLVGAILVDQPHRSVSLDSPRQGTAGLLHALAQLAVAGIPLNTNRLTQGRAAKTLNLAALPMTEEPPPSPSSWMVNGTRARPLDAPETPRLGQANVVAPRPHLDASPRLNFNASTHNEGSNGRMDQSRSANGKANGAKRKLDVNADQAILAFQENMKMFLDVQRETMLHYFTGQTAPAPSTANEVHEPLLDIEPAISTSVTIKANSPKEQMLDESRPVSAKKFEHRGLIDRQVVADRLVALVQERTGYPAETLGLTLDLEAELGIDSIKRIEILGSLREAFPSIGFGTDSAMMDELSRAKTLNAILDRVLKSAPESPGSAKNASEKPSQDRSDQVVPQDVRRLLIEPVNVPLPDQRTGLIPGSVVILSDDGRGIASTVANQLNGAGHPIVVAPARLEWTSQSVVEDLVEDARSRGLLAGIFHLLPLGSPLTSDMELSAWRERTDRELEAMFHLARAAASDLERAATLGGSMFLAATSLGGTFASRSAPAQFSPTHGAVVGLAKTLAREWPQVRVRAVDLSANETGQQLAVTILDELYADDAYAEVGYDGKHRSILRTRSVPLNVEGSRNIELALGAPIILTGGARGITATIAAELSRRWKPTLLMIGTTNRPAERESRATANVPAESLKKILHDLLREKNQASPSAIEKAYREILRDREIRANLDAFQKLGSKVEYAQVDVRDAASVQRIVHHWREQYGPAQGLIHGAGVIHDKLLRDKTSESFDRVLETKVTGALNLARAIDPSALKFTAMFSSIAGRFGNRGQGDYAAANETLNKLAIWLDQRWPGRVVSMIWGPWSKVGMVSDLEGHLGRQGLGMITPEAGAQAFVNELVFGRKGDVEVLVCGNLGEMENPPKRAKALRTSGVSQ